jgi:hypothetical protein
MKFPVTSTYGKVLCPKSSDVPLRDVLLSLWYHLVGRERRQYGMIGICYRLCWSNRMKSASVLRQLWQNRINIRLSRATVNRRGLKACRPVQRPRFNDLRKQRRLLWAHQHSRYGLRHWRHVIYTDESRCLLHRSDGRVRVRRQQGKRFREDCVVGTVMAGGSSVHIWGGIHHGGKNRLGCATKFCQRRQISIWIHQILITFRHIVVPIKLIKGDKHAW